MGIVRQGLASPTQPAESKEDKNLDCTNTLPIVATDAFIEGASNELNSEGDDADTGLAWIVSFCFGNGVHECLVCVSKGLVNSLILYRSDEAFLSHFMEEHANPAEWMDVMERV